jgi:hypothetical protein
MKKLVGVILALFLLSGIAMAYGDETGGSSESKEMKTLRGEVIDISCYVAEGARGESHKACAIACIQAGQPAGILEEGTGKVYVAAKEEDHAKNPGAELLPYVGKMVEVKGDVHERGGISTIDIKDIKEAGGSSSMRAEDKDMNRMNREKNNSIE